MIEDITEIHKERSGYLAAQMKRSLELYERTGDLTHLIDVEMIGDRLAVSLEVLVTNQRVKVSEL